MINDEDRLDEFAAILVGVSIAGAAMAGVSVVPGVTEALTAATGLLARLTGQRRSDAQSVLARLQRDLKAEWAAWGDSPHADAGLRASVVASFSEVIPYCAAIPAEVVSKRLNGAEVAEAVLRKAIAARPEIYKDADPRNSEAHLARTFLLNVTRRAYERLLAEPGYIDVLAPQLWRDLLETLHRVDATTQRTEAKVDALPDLFVARLLEELDRRNESAAAHAAGITEERILGLARRIAAEVLEIDHAFAELERMVDIAIEVQARGDAGSDTGDFVAAVLARMAALSAEGHDDKAAAEADRALSEWDERRRIDDQKAIELLEAGLRADILRRNPGSAAQRIVRRIEIGKPSFDETFDAIMRDHGTWFERGKALGLQFDLEVSVALAQAAHEISRTADQRGGALHFAGIALRTVGEREVGTARLREATTTFGEAIEERSRTRVPYDWATSQNSLGTTWHSIGDRDPSSGGLEQALAAFDLALEEWTQETAPRDWAIAQGNRGATLVALGRQKKKDIAILKEAENASLAAVQNLDPYSDIEAWSYNLENLGTCLSLIAEFTHSISDIDKALDCHNTALLLVSRDKSPYVWAKRQSNFANTYSLLGLALADVDILRVSIHMFDLALEERARARSPQGWTISTGMQGVALRWLAELTLEQDLARRAARQLTDAEAEMRSAGQDHHAKYFASHLILAKNLIARLASE